MKKMIFSAVALVAFSFAGMANEIENSLEIENALENQNCWECNVGMIIQKYAPCFSAADAASRKLREWNIEEAIIEEVAAAAFHSCEVTIDG